MPIPTGIEGKAIDWRWPSKISPIVGASGPLPTLVTCWKTISMRDDRICADSRVVHAVNSGTIRRRRGRHLGLLGLTVIAGLLVGNRSPVFAQDAPAREIMLGAVGKHRQPDGSDGGTAIAPQATQTSTARAAAMLAAARGQLEQSQPFTARKILESIIEREPIGPVSDEARRLLAPIYAGNYGTRGVVEGPREGFALPGHRDPPPGARVGKSRENSLKDVAVRRDSDNAASLASFNRPSNLSPRATRLLENEFRSRVGDRVFFGEASTDVGAKSRAILSAQATWLKRNGAVYVLIEAHAHDRGSRQHNLQLALKRADAVRARLVDEGVPEDRIRIRAYGNEKPIADCDFAACAAQNRRVVSVLVANSGGRHADDGDKRHQKP